MGAYANPLGSGSASASASRVQSPMGGATRLPALSRAAHEHRSAGSIPFPEGSSCGIDPVDRGELPEIELVGELPVGVRPGQVLALPESIADCLEIFESLDSDRWKRILRAAFWLDHSSHVWRLSKSASYQSLIQAVEVLIDVPKDQPKCSECHRTLGIGPTALFVKFLEDYAPASSDLEPARSELYSMRSSLSHGNTLLHMDQGIVYNWYGPRPPHEHMLISNARLICRRAIINWLMSQSPSPNLSGQDLPFASRPHSLGKRADTHSIGNRLSAQEALTTP